MCGQHLKKGKVEVGSESVYFSRKIQKMKKNVWTTFEERESEKNKIVQK